MKTFMQDGLILLSGAALAALALLPQAKRDSLEAFHRGQTLGMRAGMLYADELIQEGYACVQSAYHDEHGSQQVGVVCTNGIRTVVLAQKANRLAQRGDK